MIESNPLEEYSTDCLPLVRRSALLYDDEIKLPILPCAEKLES